MIICKNCGKELDDNALFCTGCGHRVKTPEFPDTPNETAETAGAETSVPEENISEPSAEIPTASADEGDSVLITDDEPTATINTAASVISDNSDTIDLSGVVSPQQPYNGGNNGSFAYKSRNSPTDISSSLTATDSRIPSHSLHSRRKSR